MPPVTRSTRLSGKEKNASLIGSGITLSLSLLVVFLVGGPYMTLHRLGATDRLPPMWILSAVWFIWFFLLGGTVGFLVSSIGRGLCRGGGAETALWRGCTCLVLSLTLTSLWYALLFGKFSLLVSLFVLAAAAGLAFLCALSWLHVSKGSALIAAGYTLWLLVLFFLQIVVLFGI